MLFLAQVGCDPSVDVLRPSDQHRYSLFGTLDVAADTNAIRVEPIGDSTHLRAPAQIEATLLLENLDAGTRVKFRDSLATVNPETYRDPTQVHTFWTTHPIEPATTYRVYVQENGTTVASATTTTPKEAPELSHETGFRLPCVSGPHPVNTFIVRARGINRVAAVQVFYHLFYSTSRRDRIAGRFVVNYYNRFEERKDHFFVRVYYGEDLKKLPGDGCDHPEVEALAKPYAEVMVAAGGPDWPEWRTVPINDLATPDSFSNVNGGHGFVRGVHSDTIKVPVRIRSDASTP